MHGNSAPMPNLATMTPQARPLPTPEVDTATVRIGYFFAGPSRKSDLGEALADLFLSEGFIVDLRQYDLLRGGDLHDLLNQEVREEGLRLSEQLFDIIISTPPCNTYSRLRGAGPGPRMLRSAEYPQGVPGLSAQERATLRDADLLLDFTWAQCDIVQRHPPKIILVEHPEDLGTTRGRRPASIWQSSHHCRLFSAGWHSVACHQCSFGAPWCKPTRCLGNFSALDDLGAHGLPHFDSEGKYTGPLVRCQHPPRYTWQRKNKHAEFPSKHTATYPEGLCKRLAQLLHQGFLQHRRDAAG